MFKKFLSILNYLGAAILLLLAFLGGYILYPIAYLFRNTKAAKVAPLWWWFDDEDGLYGAQYWRDAKGITKNNFWVSYRWCGMRNPMWNAHTKIVPKSGREYPLAKYGKLTKDGKEVSTMNMAVFHYVNDDGTWNGNAGEWMSKKHSYLGWTFVWFEKNEKVYWRFTFAKMLFSHLGLEIQIGAAHRFMFKIKLKWNKKIWEERELVDIPRDAIVEYETLIITKDFSKNIVNKNIINHY